MKTTKFLSFLLALVLMLSALSSCAFFEKERDEDTSQSQSTTEVFEESPKSYAAFGKEYDLTDADQEAFANALAECLSLMESNSDEALIDASVEKIETLFYRISDQADLAYVLFCADQKDEVVSQSYLYAKEMKNNAYADYMKLCQKVDEASFAYRDRFFEDWSANDFLQMRQYTDEVAVINKKNDEILVAYRALDPNSESFGADMSRLYVEMVRNNQALAKLFGYSNYVTFAHEMIYERDYSREDLKLVRNYLQEHLLIICKQAAFEFMGDYQAMGMVEQLQVSNWLSGDYSALSGDPVGAYLSSLPTSMKNSMSKVLQSEYSIFTNDQNAYAGAFTSYFYGDSYPFCYFGPGYNSAFTVIHEAGHFYAAEHLNGLDVDLDLAELHSQGNEWLFLEAIQNQLSKNVYDVLLAYHYYESLCTIIISVIVDEFEETVYANADSLDGSVEQLDGFMKGICARYGGEEFLAEYVTDVSKYWKLVVIESPAYYISYAVSGVTSMGLFCRNGYGYKEAVNRYQALVENVLNKESFLETLEKAGLASPFDENLYMNIAVAWNTRNKAKGD